MLKLTPNHLMALAGGKAGADLAALLPQKWLVLGGEALRPDVARTLLGAGTCRVLNHYGPTETTVGVCTFEVTSESLDAAKADGAQTVPVGRPLANTHAFVVDTQGSELPVGIPGELWLGGAGVANGYLNRPELTAERFTMFRDERVYRTGDRARRLSDGSIEFRGRADDQVKVRGFRVELGEIEHALVHLPDVQSSVVLVREDTPGDQRLVAYCIAAPGADPARHTPASMRQVLKTSLPEFMVPTAFVWLSEWPMNATRLKSANWP